MESDLSNLEINKIEELEANGDILERSESPYHRSQTIKRGV
jgi:hypothetical protein